MQITIMVAIIFYFRQDTDVADIFFLIALAVSRHPATVARMRYIPTILLGIVAPCVLGGAMKSLWLRTGTGNANYLFFQGLALWVFFALAVLEFTAATIREIEEAEDDSTDSSELNKSKSASKASKLVNTISGS
jgi:hypothetical protein